MRYAKITAFAHERCYGVSTVRKWLAEGMPHIGQGRSLRIMVPEAEAWITHRTPTIITTMGQAVITAECMQ